MRYQVLGMVASFLFVCGQSYAQKIIGQTTETDPSIGLGFANVALYKGDENGKLIKGVTSDLDGYFQLEGMPYGQYLVELSYVGYKSIRIPVVLTEKKSTVQLGKIKMAEDSKMLQGVEVRGQKSQMRFELDKKVFDVTQSIISEGASASDALSNIPSVSVDHEGTISLRNNSNVTIWINGRPSGLSEDTQAQVLEQLPAESIENIEIITNPSARFSAEGTAGIINIVMKKEKKTGYFGGVSANADTQGGYGASANVNINYNTIESFVNLGYRNRKFSMDQTSERTTSTPNGNSFLNQDSEGKMGGDGVFARAGMTWHATKKDQIGISGSANVGTRGFEKTVDSDFLNGSDLFKTQRRYTDDQMDMQSYTATIDYTHKFHEGSDLRMAATYDYVDRHKNALYKQYDLFPTETAPIDQIQEAPGGKKEWEFQVDYVNTFSEYLRLEAGYKGNIRSNRSDMSSWAGSEKLPEAIEANLTNDFTYDEQIQALYLSFAGKYDKLSYQAGVRSEYTDYTTTSKGYLDSEATKQGRDYLRLFPSAFLSYALTETQEMQLNYTSRINRPHGRMLNPFEQISDSSNISFGNPLLEPEYTTALELNYIKSWEAHMLSASIYYQMTDNVRQRVSYLEGETVYSTYGNVTNSRRAGMELVGKNRLWKFLDLTTTVNLYYYKIDGFDYQYSDTEMLSYQTEENFSWDARIIANAMLPWNLSLQVSGNYASASYSPQSKQFARYWLDAGLKRSFLDRKLNVSISVRDIFNSKKWKTETYGNNFTQISDGLWGGRTGSLTISYTFGNSKPKRSSKGRKSSHDGDMDSEMMDF